ncbi:Tm-1-like ATP-binding domain-containing protein [Neomoorella thermoacetica]|uniref:Tm-1-like ATP-binding domain-containing protein n=1 Tax=Neomoorella thermoacetica TaxID=1525 RepID=UPI0030D60726
MTAKDIAIIATVDTKEAEARFLQEFITSHGWQAPVLDVSTHRPHNFQATYSREEICRRAGVEYKDLGTLRRDAMMATMGRGAARVLMELYDRGELAGVLGIGGNQGTAIAAMAMRSLPVGLPKLIVSTVASGNVRPYVEYKDITMMFSVADLLGGPNTVSRTILSNAAGAVMGMAAWGQPLKTGERPVIAITALGNTDPAVAAARGRLVELGYEVIAFHASGTCGSAMEELIEAGLINGVLDLTPHELIGEVHGADIYTPLRPRLEAAGRRGIPQVVSLGGLDYFCFGPADTIPQRFQGRKTHYHNPYNTNVRATGGELAQVGEVMAAKLNAARGPVVVMVPLKGWSENGRAGGPLYDQEADAALVASLEANLNPGIRLMKLNAHINDQVFAASAVAVLHQLMEVSRPVDGTFPREGVEKGTLPPKTPKWRRSLTPENAIVKQAPR